MDLKIKEILRIIKREKAKFVLLQFPDGLKREATRVANIIEKNTKAKVFIWFNSCYGSCDIPLIGKLEKKFDLVFNFGHTLWPFKNKIKGEEI
ncbi:MAG: diphthamide synthesis protein [Candidatus Pacearchaeota archaeon]